VELRAVGDDHDPSMIALPTSSSQFKWVMTSAFVEEASSFLPTTFEIDGFGTMGEAAARFASLDGNTFLMMITAPDGQILVIRLRQPEGRQRTAR